MRLFKISCTDSTLLEGKKELFYAGYNKELKKVIWTEDPKQAFKYFDHSYPSDIIERFSLPAMVTRLNVFMICHPSNLTYMVSKRDYSIQDDIVWSNQEVPLAFFSFSAAHRFMKQKSINQGVVKGLNELLDLGHSSVELRLTRDERVHRIGD